MIRSDQTETAGTWQQRFRVARIFAAALASGAPTRGVTSAPHEGIVQLHAWNVPTGELRPLTHGPKGVIGGKIDPAGQFVYYFVDNSGDELGYWARVPFEGGTAVNIAPDLPPYTSWGIELSAQGNRASFFAVDESGSHLITLDLTTGGSITPPRQVATVTGFAVNHCLSPDGALAVVAVARQGSLHFDLEAIDTATGEILGTLHEGGMGSLQVVQWSLLAGDGRVLATTSAGGTTRPLFWNPRTGERQDIAVPELTGDVQPLDWSPGGDTLLLCVTTRAQTRLYLHALVTGGTRRLEHPNGSIDGASTSFAPGGEIFALWQDATHADRLIALDAYSGKERRVVLAAGEGPEARPWHSVEFTGARGDTIQGWLCLPEGDGPFPAVLETHGGPESVAMETYSPDVQAWVDAGFAWLSINYHGSTTFGSAFQQSIWGHPGDLEVEDLAAAHAWLVEQGIAPAHSVFLTGRSYGGYLTLLGLGMRPDLWRGGMAVVAIADWAVQYDDSSPAIRGYQEAFFGGTPSQRPAQYRASSPISYVDHVRAPVLVIQGKNDSRCPARPMRMYEERMRTLGKSIEVVWFDSGHMAGWADVEQAIDDQKRMMAFAQRLLARP